MKSIIFLIIICIVNFSCKNTKQVLQTSESNQSKQDSKTKVHPLENTSWIFQNYSRHKIDIKGQNLILKFGTVDNSELKYSGNSFVNKFSGSFLFSDNILTNTEKDVVTTMAGLDENLNKLETEYLKNFSQVNRWNLDSNGDLVLTISHNGEPYDVMMFQKN